MIVLGLDTSTATTAVALSDAGGSRGELRDDPLAGAHPGHATRLLGLADALLKDAQLGWSDVTRIAVGAGPGTFTGLRVGVATARGLAQSLGAELVGVSSLRALAWAISREGGATGHALAVIDARRGEVFAAAYRLAGLAELSAAAALAPQDIEAALEDGVEDWLAVGDGAVRYREQIARPGIEVAPDASPLHLVRAAAICALAADLGAGESAAVVPDYVRRPDAELALKVTS